MNNLPCHLELVSIDLDKTSAFYRELFGWNIIDCGLQNYRLIKFQPGFPMGGAILKSDEKTTCHKQWPLVYIRVESIDQTLSKAVKIGAEVLVNKTIIPARGSWAVFCDPDGNRIALWKEEQ
jgi:hypothetical protein